MSGDIPAEQPLTDAQVHYMCNYLREDGKCVKCPRTMVDKNYGPAVYGCYGLAEETLQKAREAMKL